MAYAAGRPDVDEFLSELTPDDFNGWWEMENLIPFGEEKLAWVFAAGLALLANISLATAPFGIGEVKEIVKPRDLIPWMRKKKREQPEYVNPNQAVAMVTKAMGGGGGFR